MVMAQDPRITASINGMMRANPAYPELSLASPGSILQVDNWRSSQGTPPSTFSRAAMHLASTLASQRDFERMYAEPDPYGGGVRGNIPRSGGERPRAGASTRILSGEPAERVMLNQKRDHASDDLTPATIREGILGFGQRAVQSLNPSYALGTYATNTIAGIVADVIEGTPPRDALQGAGIDALNGLLTRFTDIDRPRGALFGLIERGPEGLLGGTARPDLYLGRDLPGIRDINDENIIGPLSWRDIVGGGADIVADPVDLAFGGGVAGDLGRLTRAGIRSFDNAALRAAEGPLETSTRGALRRTGDAGGVIPVRPGGRPTFAPISGGAVADAPRRVNLEPSSVFRPPPTVQRLYGVDVIEEGDVRGLSRYAEEGRIRPDDPVVTPALRVRDSARRAVTNQATRIEARTRTIVRQSGFKMDADGRIPSLAGIDPRVPGAPTLRDVAARFPVYQQYLDDQQLRAMVELRDMLTPYRQALDEVAQIEAQLTGKPSTIQIGSRSDVMDGGFYIPRGTAETEELADIAMQRKGRFGGTRSKQGFERSATFGSEAEGIEAGYQYTPISEAMGSYVRGAGNRTLDRHTANYFLSRTDSMGRPLASTPKDRVFRRNPELAARMQDLRNELQVIRAGIGRLDERQERVIERFFSDPNFDDIDELRDAINAIQITRGPRAGMDIADLRARLGEVKAEINEIRPEYKQLLDQVRQTPRDEGRIPLPGLEAYSFPWEIADEAARVLNRERRLSSGDVTAALRALNSMFRGVQATGEMSYLGIQMAVGMFTAPRSWRRAAGAATRAWMNAGDEVLGNYLRRFDERALSNGLPTSERWAAAGLRLAEAGTEFRVGGRQAPRVVEAVMSAPGPNVARGAVRNVVRRADRGFGVAGDTMRLELANTLAHESMARGRQLTDAELKTIAESANRVTGWTPQRAAGDLGEAVNFAPRYLAARVRSLAQLGSSDVRKRQLARRLIGRYLAIAATLTVLANEARGEETDFLPFSGKNGPTWNPLEAEYKNPNFMRVRNVMNRDWSLLGPMDSLLGVLTAAGSLATNPTADPREAVERLRTILSGPLASWGADWLVFGENFDGVPLNNGEALARDLAQRIVPFAAPELSASWAQAAAQARARQFGDAASELGGGLLQGFFGARGTRLTDREMQDRFLREQGIDPDSLSGRERTAALAGTEEGLAMLEDRDAETLRRAEQGDRVAQALAVSIRTRDRLAELAASNLTEEQYRAARKEIMGESRGALDEYADVFEGFRESDDPDEQNAARWYDLFEDAKGPGGLPDYDLFDELESEFIASLTPDEWERVQEITGLIDPRLPEMEQRYRQARQEIEDAGLFELRDQAWDTIGEQEFFAATIEGFDDFYDFRESVIRDVEDQLKDAGWPPGVARAEAEYAAQSHPVVEAHGDLMSVLREQWIIQNTQNGVADLATLWGYLTPTKDMRQAIAEGMALTEATP